MLELLEGDCIDKMKELKDKSVNCVVTSPPYFGLRDYGGDEQIGLEDKHDCLGWATGERCGKCFVCRLTNVFREVWRVLRNDGTVWLNLGDSYAGGGNNRGNKSPISQKQASNAGAIGQCGMHDKNLNPGRLGLKQKDLIGIPWRVAFSLQADGWYLRQDIIWSKVNPMPESVKDRCTKSHEYVFLLTKSNKYWYDAEAIKEEGTIPKGTKAAKGSKERGAQVGVNSRPPEYKIYDGKRNKRSVWWVKTKPFKGAHFATFPPELIEPCILAGCPEKGILLDPFIGSGTTAEVALTHNRQCIGIDLDKNNLDMTYNRVENILKKQEIISTIFQ